LTGWQTIGIETFVRYALPIALKETHICILTHFSHENTARVSGFWAVV